MPLDKPTSTTPTKTWLDSISGLVGTFSNVRKKSTMTLVGDSFSAYQRFTDGNNNYKDSALAASCWRYALATWGDAVDVLHYRGVGGYTSQDLLDNIQDVLDNPTDIVAGQIGVNSFYGSNFTAEQEFNNVKSYINQCIANGSLVIWLNCYPQNAARANFSAAKSKASADYNKLLADWAGDIDALILVDVYSSFVDQEDDTNGAAIANYIGTDDIHLSEYGSFLSGELIVDATANYIYQSSNRKDMSPLTTGYGTVNMSNFNGTGGVSGTGVTAGTVPDDWTLSRVSGESTALTGTYVDGDYVVTMTKAVAGTSSKFRLRTDDLNSLFSDDDVIKAKFLLSVDPGPLTLEEMRVYGYVDNGSDPFFTVDNGRSINGFTPITPQVITDKLFEIAPFLMLDAPLVDVNFYIELTFKGSGVATLTAKGLRITDA